MGLLKIVDDLVAEFGGGSEYFDNLDRRIRLENGWVPRALMAMARTLWGRDVKFLLSGSSGYHWANWVIEGHWCNGGVRHGATITEFKRLSGIGPHLMYPVDIAELPERLVLLDDSFYKGRTLDAVTAATRGRVIGAVVAYDGAREPRSNVFSLYRWRDRVQNPDSDTAQPTCTHCGSTAKADEPLVECCGEPWHEGDCYDGHVMQDHDERSANQHTDAGER